MRKFASTTINELNKKLFRIGDFHFNLVSLIFTFSSFFLSRFSLSLSLFFLVIFYPFFPYFVFIAKMAELLQLVAHNSDILIFAISFLSLSLSFFLNN